MKKIFVLVLFLFTFTSFVFAENAEIKLEQDEKYNLLIQKGYKLEKAGNYEEAFNCYEEAYEYSNNIQPLLSLANLYIKIDLYGEAEKCLTDIPIEKLSNAGKSEVLFLLGKVFIYKNKIGEAAINFRNCLKHSPDKVSAKIKLAMINLLSGMSSYAEELLSDVDLNGGSYEFSDLRLLLALDMYSGNFGRAYETCALIGNANLKYNKSKNFIDSITNQPFFIFISFLPLLLSRYLAIFYYFILFIALGLIASALAQKTKFIHILIFVITGVSLLAVAQNYCIKDIYNYFLFSYYCDIYEELWIIPRIIISSHLVALSLFLIFPCFRFMREEIRPVSYELLGIWLFCFFFGIFVLTFQSKMMLTQRLIYISIGLFLSFLSALIMPFGRLFLLKISQKTGLSFLGKIGSSQLSEDNFGFTDLKILENKMVSYLNNGEIESAISLGKKVLNSSNQKSLPYFWISLIIAYIYNEDYQLAKRNINDFYQMFQGTDYYESCQICEAWLKTEKSDFPIAYKLINSISAERAKSMKPDEVAISLLVLARCCLDVKDNVQAHMNLNKALNCAKSNILKFVILTDISELDCMMKAKQSLMKWKSLAISLKAVNEKCVSYLNIIESMAALTEDKYEESLKIATRCLKSKVRNGKAFAWLGHLLCIKGKYSEAEQVLAKMTPGSYSAERLMMEVTSTSAN